MNDYIKLPKGWNYTCIKMLDGRCITEWADQNSKVIKDCDGNQVYPEV